MHLGLTCPQGIMGCVYEGELLLAAAQRKVEWFTTEHMM